MARFHLDWEVVESRLSSDPKQIATGWNALIGLVKKDFEQGVLKDWGAYPGDRAGYAVVDGSEMDVLGFTMQYAPHISFRTRPVVSAGQVGEFLGAILRK
jgi:hypothetical protein